MIDIVPGRHSPLNDVQLKKLLENYPRQNQQQLLQQQNSEYQLNNNNIINLSKLAENANSLHYNFGHYPGDILNLPPRRINISKRNDDTDDDQEGENNNNLVNKSKVESRKLMDYLRSISYVIADTDAPESGNVVQNSAASFQQQSISSLYVDTKPLADQVWLYNAQVGTANHSYIKSRSATAITIYPLLLSRGIKTVDQLLRISAKDVDFLRRSLCRDTTTSTSSSSSSSSSPGLALFAAILARLQRDAVDPSCEGLEIFRPSQLGSGVDVKCNVHHSMGIAQDVRPEDHSLPWHKKKVEYTVVCKQCAPVRYGTDVESRIEKEGNGVVCPQPPWILKRKKKDKSMMMAAATTTTTTTTTNIDRIIIPNPPNVFQSNFSNRLFDPKPNIRTGRMFIPRLTTLQHQLLPSNILPEESDEVTWNQKKDKRKVKMNVGDAKAPNDILLGGNNSSMADSLYEEQENYDPFRCRAVMTFTFDEMTVTTKILNAVKEVIDNAYIRGGSNGPEPFVDATSTLIAPGILAQAFASMGVEPRALAVITHAVNRGRLSSVMFSSSGGGGGAGSGGAGMGRRRSSASPTSTSMMMRPSSAGNMRNNNSPSSFSLTKKQNSSSTAQLKQQKSGSFTAGRRTSTLSSASRGSPRDIDLNSKPSGGKGVTIADLVVWIEQKLDAPKFLKQIFCRYSRSTPWIIFRHEIDEAIRSRVSGINMILQMMNESNVDILPFEKFASEVSKGKTAIAFSQQFVADGIRFIAENANASSGGRLSRKGSSIGGGSANSLRRAGSSTMSSSRAK
jgi:hypothetical protein